MDSALQRDVGLRELWAAHMRNKGVRLPSDALREAAARRWSCEQLRIGTTNVSGWRAPNHKVDVGFPGPKVAIEVDGFAFHSGPVEFQVDRERQNNIALLGWQVLRFTWLDLTEYPQRVLAVVRLRDFGVTALRRRTGTPNSQEAMFTK